MPTPERSLTAMALRLDGRVYLFDCGEGAQVPYRRARLGLRGLHLVAVSHHHADHVLGLPGILMMRAQMPDPPPLTVLGPPNVERFIQHVCRDLEIHINYDIRFIAWHPDAGPLAYEDDRVRVIWNLLDHTVPCLGYRLEERDRPGRFAPETATALGVPKGPLWGELQAGKTIQGLCGPVSPDQVLGPSRLGRRVAYATDTAPTEALVRLLHGVDIAFLEGMYAPDEAEHAAEKKHLTVIQACEAATRACVRRLVLTHLSPRYDETDVLRMEETARRHHPEVEMGRDGRVFVIPFGRIGSMV